MVSAICPNCHILLVEATSNSDANLYAAENEAATLGATEISNSWSGGEYSGESSDSSTYFDHPGIAITAASGDSGYAAGTQFPASSQYVTAVGGTTLSKASGTTRGWSVRLVGRRQRLLGVHHEAVLAAGLRLFNALRE